MAEIGLVKFATIALQVGQAALPAYRSKFAKSGWSWAAQSVLNRVNTAAIQGIILRFCRKF